MIYTVTLNPALDRTLTVNRLDFNQVLRAQNIQLDWGGKGFNVSRALQALGLSSTCIGFVGGLTGQAIQDGLASLAIDTRLIWIASETRTNIVIEEAGSEKHIKVNEAGPVISLTEQHELIKIIEELASPGDDWIFSGSLPQGIPDGIYSDLIELVQRKECRAYLDTSGKALKNSLPASPFLVKPNREEAEFATGISCSDQDGLKKAALFFLEHGIQWVAISCGKDGLLLANQKKMVFAPAPKIRVHNSVGAGDALLAGIIRAFLQGFGLLDSAAFGVASGSAAASLEGVNFGKLDFVEKLFIEVRIQCKEI